MSWLKTLFGKKEAGHPIEKIDPILSFQIPPPSADDPPLYQDQVLRKSWFEQILKDEGIPVNPHLPCLPSEAETTPRSAREVADRLVALCTVAIKGEGENPDEIGAAFSLANTRSLFTPNELAFIDNPAPSQPESMQFVWRYEAAWVLFWALNFLEGPLSKPTDMCDVPHLLTTVRDCPDLAARDIHVTNNMLNEADLIYRCHWAIRQAQIDGKPTAPAGLHPGVVLERHHALNWLIRLDGDSGWDDVDTST